MRRFFLCLGLLGLVSLHCGAVEITKEQLVGQWRYQDDEKQLMAQYVFREDGTFTAELHVKDELQRKFAGRWDLMDGTIVYTYEKDSMGQIESGSRERDRVHRLDESSYTIEGGDGGHRTYFRVTESR